MGFQLTASDYMEYIERAYQKIHENQDYVTQLDLATGDGDHWSNINMGFEKLVLWLLRRGFAAWEGR